MLSNTFRMVFAMVCSLPLMTINLSTLYHQLQSDDYDSDAMDLNKLKAGNSVYIVPFKNSDYLIPCNFGC